jgi:hypothetical protein
MKQIFLYILLLFSARVFAQPHANTPEVKLTVKKEGWQSLGGKRCMRLNVIVKNISGHSITYVRSDFVRHMFRINTPAIDFFYPSFVDLGRHFEFSYMVAGGTVQFPVHVYFTNDQTSNIEFRLGFVWTIPNTQSEIEFKNAAAKNEVVQKVFWSNTLTLHREK